MSNFKWKVTSFRLVVNGCEWLWRLWMAGDGCEWLWMAGDGHGWLWIDESGQEWSREREVFREIFLIDLVCLANLVFFYYPKKIKKLTGFSHKWTSKKKRRMSVEILLISFFFTIYLSISRIFYPNHVIDFWLLLLGQFFTDSDEIWNRPLLILVQYNYREKIHLNWLISE